MAHPATKWVGGAVVMPTAVVGALDTAHNAYSSETETGSYDPKTRYQYGLNYLKSPSFQQELANATPEELPKLVGPVFKEVEPYLSKLHNVPPEKLEEMLMSGGKPDAAKLQRMVEAPAGQDLMKYMAARGSADPMRDTINWFKNADPGTQIAAGLGIPLALFGVMQMLGGKGGIGGLLMMLLGGGLTAGSAMGAFAPGQEAEGSGGEGAAAAPTPGATATPTNVPGWSAFSQGDSAPAGNGPRWTAFGGGRAAPPPAPDAGGDPMAQYRAAMGDDTAAQDALLTASNKLPWYIPSSLYRTFRGQDAVKNDIRQGARERAEAALREINGG